MLWDDFDLTVTCEEFYSCEEFEEDEDQIFLEDDDIF